MAKVDRKNPTRGSASESTYSLMEFTRDFPDDDACLNYLVGMLYPDGMFCEPCGKVTKHHKDANRPSWCCQFCGDREHPLVGTIFEKSPTSLHLWFYAIYLMSSTRCGISAKQLERELGVTYKTAWRMFNKIRTLLGDDGSMFDGEVEIDAAYIGGKAVWRSPARNKRIGNSQALRARHLPVLGIAQRKNAGRSGKIAAVVIPSTQEGTVLPHIAAKVSRESTVYTDDAASVRSLPSWGYDEHYRINHSQKVYVSGDVHTNTVEGFWSLLKRGISGVYHGVGERYLQSYLDEYTFRYNHRDDARGMFNAFLSRVRKGVSEQPS